MVDNNVRRNRERMIKKTFFNYLSLLLVFFGGSREFLVVQRD